MGPVRVKICCIRDVEEARLAVDAGASALGLVSEMPSGPGVIDEETIAAVAAAAPPAVATFLLTCLPDAARIADQVRRTRVSTVQICDRPEPGTAAALRRALPALKIVQVVHVTGPASVDEAVEEARGRGRDPARLRQPGARASRSWAARAAATTGRSAREIVARVPRPVFLAGGLTARERGGGHPRRAAVGAGRLQRRAHRTAGSTRRSWRGCSPPSIPSARDAGGARDRAVRLR